MQVVICSIFRDAQEYIPRYFNQAGGLAELLEARGDSLRFNLAEGDSEDRTFEQLHGRIDHQKSRIIKRSHGGPKYGSVGNIARFLQMSYVYAGVWEGLRETDDVVVYVESDLIWEPSMMMRLMCQLAPVLQYPKVDAVAPMIWNRTYGEDFYDTWAFRRNGVNFGNGRNPHPDVNGHRELLELDSAGSCIVMTGQAARAARFEPPELQVVGLCQSMRAKGYRLWVDPEASVIHP